MINAKTLNRLLCTMMLLLCPLIAAGQGTISIPGSVLTLGQSGEIPVNLSNDSGQEIFGIRMEFRLDTTLFTFEHLVRASTISDSLAVVFNQKTDTVIVAMSATHPVTQSGKLLGLSVIPKVIGKHEIELLSYRINEEEEVFPQAPVQVIVFDIGGNQPPLISNIPDTLSFVAGDTLEIFLDESVLNDAEDNVSDLKISILVDPPVVTFAFDTLTNLLTITTADYAGFATLSLIVEDMDGGIAERDIIIEIAPPVSNESEDQVIEFSLEQNYPNPFNPSSTIRFNVPVASEVQLAVYNMLGQQVATLVDSRLAAGSHTITFNAAGLSTGTYIYRLRAGNLVQTRKMMLIK